MGRHSVAAISADPELELVGELGKGADLGAAIIHSKAQVVLDFTTASAAYDNTLCIIEKGAHPVIGTSGLSLDTVRPLQKLAAQKKLGGLIAPNFTIGALLMMRFAKEAAAYFPQVEIVEMHHPLKKDAPSGTAIRTAELIAEQHASLAVPFPDDTARGDLSHGVPIHSLRLSGVFTHQEVIFGAPGETLTIQHHCSDRLAAMPGVVLACKKVVALDHLVYGLEHLL